LEVWRSAGGVHWTRLRIAHLLVMMALPGGWRLRSAGSSYRADHGECNITERGREMEIRRGQPQNVHGNDKMERKRRDERDDVLTVGQR
jgi:hypothetical protein